MPQDERDRDELDGNPQSDEETRGLEDDDFEEGDEEDSEDLDDEELTGEVGSEGGSPGDSTTTRRPAEQIRGGEAGEIKRDR